MPFYIFVGNGVLLWQLDDAEEWRVGVGKDVASIQVLDPDLLIAAKLLDSGCVAGLVASVVGWRGVGDDCVDAGPTLNEGLAIDHHRVTVASCRIVVQYLRRAKHTHAQQ